MTRYRQGIMATVCVPWNGDFSFAQDLFRRQVRHLVSHGIRDLYIFGTAGEGYAVTEAQFDSVARVFLEETRAPGVQPLIGIISLSLPAIIGRIERAIAMGATRFQISLPCWGALNDAELEEFFAETCGRFPQCEFMHYNLARSRRLLTPAEYARLAERHRNLVATKNGSEDAGFLAALLAEAPMLRHFITEPGFAGAAMLGECGLLLSIASVNLKLAREYFEAGARRDEATLGAMRTELKDMIAAVLASVKGAAHMDGAFDKMYCRIHDPRFPLRLLPPHACAPERAFHDFVEILRSRHARWIE